MEISKMIMKNPSVRFENNVQFATDLDFSLDVLVKILIL